MHVYILYVLRKVNPKQKIRLKIRKEKEKSYIKRELRKIRKGRKGCNQRKKKEKMDRAIKSDVGQQRRHCH